MLLLVGVTAWVRPSTATAAEDGQGTLLAELEDPPIAESSGLAASRRQPGVLWTHNDSGDGARLYAIDRDGRSLGTFEVPGTGNVDWEDLAIGPGADGTDTLYVADTGDNERRRTDAAILRLPEPTVDLLALPPFGTIAATAPAERFPLVYPDGPRDVEALLVHPKTGEILLVSKESTGPAVVFRLPPLVEPDRALTPTPIATRSLPGLGPFAAATDGAVAADGSRLVLRTPAGAVIWTIGPGATMAEAIREEPRRLPIPPTPRGEAIAFRADSAALLLTTEGMPGRLFEQPIAAATIVPQSAHQRGFRARALRLAYLDAKPPSPKELAKSQHDRGFAPDHCILSYASTGTGPDRDPRRQTAGHARSMSMDREDFDNLARAFAREGSRRSLIKRALGGVLGGALAMRGVAPSSAASTCRVLAESCNGEGPDCCDGLECVENPENSRRSACMPVSQGGTPGTAGTPGQTIRLKQCRECQRRCRFGKPVGAKRNRHRTCLRRCANICKKP